MLILLLLHMDNLGLLIFAFATFSRRGWTTWRMGRIYLDFVCDYVHHYIPLVSALETFSLSTIDTLSEQVHPGDQNFLRYIL